LAFYGPNPYNLRAEGLTFMLPPVVPSGIVPETRYNNAGQLLPMSEFEDLATLPADFSGTVRLFPLPNLVLFPHVMQPLHIFEPRYRELLEDALAGDQLIAMALLRPGWEDDYEGRPPIYPVACLGRIATHHRLEDGTYNVLLLGARRVRLLREVDPARSFRRARVEVFEDVSLPNEAGARADLQHRLRQAFLRILPTLPHAQEQLDVTVHTPLSNEAAG
jgi:Lon protease-like protein